MHAFNFTPTTKLEELLQSTPAGIITPDRSMLINFPEKLGIQIALFAQNHLEQGKTLAYLSDDSGLLHTYIDDFARTFKTPQHFTELYHQLYQELSTYLNVQGPIILPIGTLQTTLNRKTIRMDRTT